MKRVNIINNKNKQKFSAIMEDPTEWIELCKTNNAWGKSERWVKAKIGENFPEEVYLEKDVLQTESKQIPSGYEKDEFGETVFDKDGSTPKINYNTVEYALLKAEYDLEIIDLDTDYDYLLAECHKKRRAEYPSISDCTDALFWKEKGDSTLYNSYIEKCRLIKEKYPKPILLEKN